jgi:glycosyltransferase involved in cell wall biosynthesis
VLIVSPLPPPYGGISHWTAMVRDYAQNAPGTTQLTVLDTAPRSRPALQASTVRRVGEGLARMIVDNARLLRELMRNRPDVVHLNTSGHLAFFRDLAMAWLLRAFRVPLIYHLRFGRLADTADRGNWEWRVAKAVLRRAAVVVALDPRTEQCLRENRASPRVVRIPNPIRRDRFVGEEFPALQRPPVILYVGWVIPSKGIGELLDAWRRLKHGEWLLEIVGPGDPDYVDRIRSALPEATVLTGALDNQAVQAKMRSSRIFVFPSHTEGFPNAVAEAMASGMAVVATDVGAIGDMLSGETGIVVEPGDVGALAKELDRLMRDPNAVRDLGARARTKALQHYELGQVFERYENLWRGASRE